MKQIFNKEELINKTIAATENDGDEMYIKFTDNSFVVLKHSYTGSGFGYNEYKIVISDYPEEKTNDILLNLGIVSQKEYDKACLLAEEEEQKRIEAYYEKEKQQQLEYEKKVYEELKEKFNKK